MHFTRQKHRLQSARRSEQGFTIVELMIAVTILSILLLVGAEVLINLGTLYTKSNNEGNTQAAARNIVNELASQLQLGSAVPATPSPITLSSPNTPATGTYASPVQKGALCLGDKRYSYILNAQEGVSTQHVLWRDTMKNAASCPLIGNNPAVPGSGGLTTNMSNPGDSNTVPGSGVELMPNRMRLTQLSVTPATNGAWTITVTVVYGDNDLFTYVPAGVNPADTRCLSSVGQQYCATSSLTVTVVQRIQQ